MHGIDFPEHAGRTRGEYYPYLACVVAANDNAFWQACLAAIDAMDERFQRWFGDQVAIRDVVRSGRFRTRELPESVYAHLTSKRQISAPRIVHFKGALKRDMAVTAARLGV